MRRVAILLLAAAAIAAASIGWSRSQQSGGRSAREGGPLVVTTTAKRQDLALTVTETGVVAAKHSTPVIPEVSGRILWICGNGLIVKAGETVLRLDPKPFEEAVEDLDVRLGEAARRRAKADVVGKAREKELQLRLQRGQNDATAFERGQQVTLQQAAEAIKFHEAELAKRKEDAEVTRRLAARGLIAGTEVERQDAGVKAAEFSLQRERGDYELKKSQAASDAARRRMGLSWTTRDMGRARGSFDRDMRMGGNEVENLTRQIERAREDLPKTTLTAPVGGLVVLAAQGGQQGDARLPRPGDFAPQGREVASIVTLERMLVKLELDQRQIAGVRMGQPVEITIEALPGRKLKGKIASIGQNARRPPVQGWTGISSAATFPVTVDLPPTGKALIRPGMRASVRAVSRLLRGVTTVPTGCIFTREGKRVLYVERGGVFVQAPVTLGESNGEYTVVKSGVRAGERIALNDLGAEPAAKGKAK